MALAPKMSDAVQVSAAGVWIEVCTMSGATWVNASGDIDEAAPMPTPTQSHADDHCPYCDLRATAIGMPVAPVVLPLLTAKFEFAARFLAAPRTAHAWRAAQARAPPLFS